MPALKALLLSDGKPGHFRLSEGILAAIERKRDVATHRMEVRRRPLVPARVVSHLINAGISPARILTLVYGIKAADLPPADLVVSAGGNTLGANIAAARILEASNIFYGSLRRSHARDFSLALTSYASQARAPNQLMALKPSAVDPDTFAHAPDLAQSPPAVAGLILGGDSGTIKFDQTDWQRLFAFIAACFEQHATRWIISNSARTPDAVSRNLKARIANGEHPEILSFIDVRDANAPPLHALFSQAETVVCTADSSTMLSECVWAQKPVLAVEPDSFSLPDNESAYRKWLAQQGWAAQMPISKITPQMLTKTLDTLAPLTQNPLDRLADDLHRRLPQLFD